MIDSRATVAGIVALLAPAGAMRAPRPALPFVNANDNRVPAGRLHGDRLDVRLVVAMATWHPEADSGTGIDVAAFAEEGRPPAIPAPLIRVRTGVVVHAVVRNALSDSTITIHGLLSRPATTDSTIVLRPGDSASVRFAAGAPGTYLYFATLGHHRYGVNKDDEREQLGGAFVVDSAKGSPPDRVFVMNIWGQTIGSARYRNALTINGRSWPYDERIDANVGDTLRWRIVNATDRRHPMHLHGFYFRIGARGTGLSDTIIPTADQASVVTDRMDERTTMTIEWTPNRPGNWLFHCHIGFHVVPGAARLDPVPFESHDRMSGDARMHMAGLVLGIRVHPTSAWHAVARKQPNRMRMFIDEGRRRGRSPRAMGFVLQRGARTPAPDSVEIPGSLLVLTRNQPTDITVVNRLKEPGAVHWHGIELESWSDGVAGWSGADTTSMAPAIPAADSFVAHLTLPRAGTFIYHTHMNDLEQLTSGLYGGIVVLDPGRRFDPATDHVFIVGWDSPDKTVHLLLNGDSIPGPMHLRGGVEHRLRFINIGAAAEADFRLSRNGTPVLWRALAKDGADLPRTLATTQSAKIAINVGETYDFSWNPAPGTYQLHLDLPSRAVITQLVIVR